MPRTAATCWRLGYHRDDVTPGGPVIAVPTTAGTGAETNTYGVITDEAAGRKGYVGHPSLLPLWSVLDPVLTVGLPPAATAATGVDAMTHSLESLAVAQPEPVRRGDGPAGHPDRARVAAAGRRRWHGPGGALAVAHGLAPGRASASRAGPGVGLVHALGHAIGTRGRLPHGLALAVVIPEVMAFYADSPGLRDRELALVGVAIRAASPTEEPATGAIAAIGAMRGFLAEVGLRPIAALARLRRGAAGRRRPGRHR